MKKKQTASSIWQEYQKGVTYNTRMQIYDTVKKNENFYIGKQWEGLRAPDLAKPVINVLKRVVSYFISMIVSDDVGATFTPFQKSDRLEREAKILSDQVEQVIEQANVKALSREALRDAAVDGDGCLYFYFDPDAESGQEARGRICAELLPNTSVYFGNPYDAQVQAQPYIILAMRKTLEAVREEARELGVSKAETAAIVPDEDRNRYDPSGGEDDALVTVLLKFWRQDGEIWAAKATHDVMLREPWSTGYTRYPLALLPWEKMKNAYHGVSAISAMIPNQIAINQLFAMAIHHVKTMAFPKVIYDASKIPNWSNKVGQAIGTIGNPNDAVATGFRAPDMSAQVLELIERLTQKTLEFMGASDAALGNVQPNNTSAIIATQKASAMPLELQRLAFYRFTEEYVRIIVDMIREDYGLRRVNVTEDGVDRSVLFDFSEISDANLSMQVDVGAATYWSELMQIQTMDNLFTKGIITDAITYLEGVPDRYIRGKGKILDKLREAQQQAEAQQNQPALPQGQAGEMMAAQDGAAAMMPAAQ